MSKPRRSRHRIPAQAFAPVSDPVDESYQAQVDRNMDAVRQRYEALQRRIARHEERLRQIRSQQARGHGRREYSRQINEMQAEIALRRIELEKYERMMIATSTPARHRGVDSFRPVPAPGSRM